MTDDNRTNLAFSACELLRARGTRDSRRRALNNLVEVLAHGDSFKAQVVEHLRTVLDSDYCFNQGEKAA